jgi:hypothetical protein
LTDKIQQITREFTKKLSSEKHKHEGEKMQVELE